MPLRRTRLLRSVASLLPGLAAACLLQGCRVRRAQEDQGPPGCKAFEFTIPHRGLVRVSASRRGESPVVACPVDYAYRGPSLQCSVVDRACLAASEDGAKGAGERHCKDVYGVTVAGEGLVEWPGGVAPRGRQNDNSSNTALRDLISTAQAPRNASGLPVQDTSAELPAISLDSLRCVPEPYIDLDFHRSEVFRTAPSSRKSSGWSIRFRDIVATDDMGSLDLVVTRQDSRWPPGDPEKDGKGSMMGTISIGGGAGEVPLRFRFARSGSDEPIALAKFYFTVFDVSDDIDGLNDKEVTVSGISEYFLTAVTRLSAAKTKDGELKFTGRGRGEKAAGRHDVRKMWQSSLHGTVGLMFRNTSEFTLKVRSAPGERLRQMDFAGWSEIVKYGRKVFSVPRQTPINTGAGKDSLFVNEASEQAEE